MTTSASTAPRTLRIGIAGCGAISRNHLEAFRALDNVQVVGVCDIDLERARATAEAWGVPAAVNTVGELLGLDLDIISVCTPHPTHEEVVLQAAAAGVHVLCEKPIATELDVRGAHGGCLRGSGSEAGRPVPAPLLARGPAHPCRHRRRHTGPAHHGPVLRDAAPRTRSTTPATPGAGTWANDGGGVLMTQAIH